MFVLLFTEKTSFLYLLSNGEPIVQHNLVNQLQYAKMILKYRMNVFPSIYCTLLDFPHYLNIHSEEIQSQ